MLLSIQNLTKQFNGTTALDAVSLDVTAGEIVCLLGPSGCGKTTLLRIIAGLERADAGRILCAGTDLDPIPPHQRDFGLMFQDYALFPHKSVFENVAFGLRMKEGWNAKRGRLEDWKAGRLEDGETGDSSASASPTPHALRTTHYALRDRVLEMLDLVGLAGFGERSVTDLSGGEAQRVALARSLAPQPRLLMLDEPLGALDRALRERLMGELRDILKRVGVTAIYVTHDQAEAFAIADRVVVMRAGRLEQIGPPEEIYRAPASPFVARFLGLNNLAEGEVLAPGCVASAWGELAVETGDFQAGQAVTVLIRPEVARLLTPDAAPPEGVTPLRGRLTRRSFRGGRYKIEVRPAQGPSLTFELTTPGAFTIEPGQPLTLWLDPAGIVLLERE